MLLSTQPTLLTSYLSSLGIDVESYLSVVIEEHSKSGVNMSMYDESVKEQIQNREKQELVDTLNKYKQQLGESFLRGLVKKILNRWLIEADKANDLETQSLIHAYLALLWNSLKPSEFNVNNVTELLGSIAFVRNWHGFGLGANRGDLLWDSSGNFDPEMRLLRFLQAQGIDTTSISKQKLDNYVQEASRRPLFLHIGHRTIRAPRLVKFKEVGAEGEGIEIDKLPPADIPEPRLFQLLGKHRRAICAWLEAAPEKVVDGILQNVTKVALRSEKFTYKGWKHLGQGRFFAEQAEIKFDAQSAEMFWRNASLKPVPDSMTQFIDFETLFQGKSFYCGLLCRTSRNQI